jgi:oligopeptide transport system permease protein
MTTLAGDPVPIHVPRRLRMPTSGGAVGMVILLLIGLPCLVTLPWSLRYYHVQDLGEVGSDPRRPPSLSEPFGTDQLGRSLLWRCLLGGAISLGIGLSAAAISVCIGVSFGAVAGLAGGRVDAAMMRVVDVLYGLPYILLVVLVDIAAKPMFERLAGLILSGSAAQQVADVVTLLVAIGAVSWLTLARVIRGQVLSLRAQPFVEAARACGCGPMRVLRHHLLPNLIGPIVVYTTLTVPTAILQESFLSFLGIGVQDPLPSWGNLAARGIEVLHVLGDRSTAGQVRWWLLLWPCLLLGLTLMALNFMGDWLRSRLDPRGVR